MYVYWFNLLVKRKRKESRAFRESKRRYLWKIKKKLLALERANYIDSSIKGYTCYPALSYLMEISVDKLSNIENLIITNASGSVVFRNVDLIGIVSRGINGEITTRRAISRREIPARIIKSISITPEKCCIDEDLSFTSAVCSLKYCYNWNLSSEAFFTSLLLKKATIFLDRNTWTGEWSFFFRDAGIYSSEFSSDALIDKRILSSEEEDIWIVQAARILVRRSVD
jgi:hypothetical protein